jgi:uncharacterized protein involved in exopolysaccharide biosynthesis
MAEVSNELIYEVLKKLQNDGAAVNRKPDEIKSELQALRNHSIAVQQEIQNIYTILVRHDARLTRIERRLDIVEVT